MYEAHFGIQAPPFQLSPDPGFYFDSAQHRHARALLREGVQTPGAFVVLTGEIGAGKTTLVQAVIAERDLGGCTVAHVLSTQLDAAELLVAISLAFGLVPEDASSCARRRTAMLRKLAAPSRQPALIVIDEAQNLHGAALTELALLLADARAAALTLGVALVGQPQLRAKLEAAPSSVKQLISHTCHIAAMERSETRAYIEHRLRTAGWSGTPGFGDDACDEIFDWTDGLPRRINLLCNRLLLSRFLAGRCDLDAGVVAQVAAELHDEVGSPSGAARPAPHRKMRAQVLCVVDSLEDHIMAAPLLRALSAHESGPAPRLLRTSANQALHLSRELFGDFDLDTALIELPFRGAVDAASAAGLGEALAQQVAQGGATTIVAFAGSDSALVSARVARRIGARLAVMGAGVRGDDDAIDRIREQTECVADLLFAADNEAGYRLSQEVAAPARVFSEGSLIVDALHIADALLPAPDTTPSPLPFAHTHGSYALVTLGLRSNIDDPQMVAELVAMLRDMSRDIPLVWPLQRRMRSALERRRVIEALAGDGIVCLEPQPYLRFVDLLRNATCAVTDCASVEVAAHALDVPSLIVGRARSHLRGFANRAHVVGSDKRLATRAMWHCLFNAPGSGPLPPLWDGHAASRMAGRFLESISLS